MKTSLRRWALALATPALFALYAKVPEFSLLNFWFLVPWAFLADEPGAKARPFLWISVFWLTQLGLYPQLFKFAWYFPLVRGAIYLWPWLAFPWLLLGMRRLWPRAPMTWLLPVAWTATEYLRSVFSLAHFDLYALGYSQVALAPFVQLADVTGVYGVSFLVAMVNGFLVDAIRAWRAGSPLRSRPLRGAFVSLAVLHGFAWGYGAFRLATLKTEPGPSIAVVQPNLKHSFADAVGVHLEQLWMTERGVASGEADLIVWPENAILDNFERPGAYLPDLEWLAARKDAALLVGAMGKSTTRPGYTTNTAFLLDEEGEIRGRYDKQLLFPWSEFVPWDDAVSGISPRLGALHRRLIRMGWGFLPTGQKGRETTILELPSADGPVPFGVLICVENTYPPIPAAAARGGARFLVNITSEGEVGGPVQAQLLKISALRAVETRLAYVRAGNSGISTFIEPSGRTQAVLVGENGGLIFDRGVLTRAVPLAEGRGTIYASSRDAFAKLCLAVAVVAAGAGFRRRFRSDRGRGVPATGVAVGSVGLSLVLVSTALAPGCRSTPPAAGLDDARASLARALEAEARGDWIAALDAAREACTHAATCEDALPTLREAFVRTGQPETGLLHVEGLDGLAPDFRDRTHEVRGYLLEKSLEWNEAAAEYEAAIRTRPTSFAYLQYGNLLMRMERPADAERVFRDGLEHDPSATGIRYFLARTLRLRGALDEAKAILEDLLLDDPEHANAWVNLARVYAEAGEHASAEGAFEKALSLDPANVEARWQQAKRAMETGDLASAERWIREIRMIQGGGAY